MILTAHDRPIGKAKVTTKFAEVDPPAANRHQYSPVRHKDTLRCRIQRQGMTPEEAATLPRQRAPKGTLQALSREFGITTQSIVTWKWRHPGHGLTNREVAKIVWANKKRRQS